MKPKKKQGLTTTEASEMLGGIISRSTIGRYLDKGILTGRKNPITGYRIIDLKSVEVLAKKSGIDFSKETEVWPRRSRSRKTSKPSSGSGR